MVRMMTKTTTSTKPYTFDLTEGHRPGVEEHGLHIEDHEEQGEEVVAEVELHPGAALSGNAALVDVLFDGVRLVQPNVDEAEQPGANDGKQRKEKGCNKQETYLAVIPEHPLPSCLRILVISGTRLGGSIA